MLPIDGSSSTLQSQRGGDLNLPRPKFAVVGRRWILASLPIEKVMRELGRHWTLDLVVLHLFRCNADQSLKSQTAITWHMLRRRKSNSGARAYSSTYQQSAVQKKKNTNNLFWQLKKTIYFGYRKTEGFFFLVINRWDIR